MRGVARDGYAFSLTPFVYSSFAWRCRHDPAVRAPSTGRVRRRPACAGRIVEATGDRAARISGKVSFVFQNHHMGPECRALAAGSLTPAFEALYAESDGSPKRDELGTQRIEALASVKRLGRRLSCGCPRNCKRRALHHRPLDPGPGRRCGAMRCEPGDLPSIVVTREWYRSGCIDRRALR